MRVIAVNAVGESDPSDEVTGTPPETAETPEPEPTEPEPTEPAGSAAEPRC